MQQSDPTLLTFLCDVRQPNTLPTSSQHHLGIICTEVLSIHRMTGHWLGRTVGYNPMGTWSESYLPRKAPRCPPPMEGLGLCKITPDKLRGRPGNDCPPLEGSGSADAQTLTGVPPQPH
jgi:hypothetical protein